MRHPASQPAVLRPLLGAAALCGALLLPAALADTPAGNETTGDTQGALPDSVSHDVTAAAAADDPMRPPLTLEQLTVRPSPEAWSMSRHTDDRVDLCRGTGTVEVPVFSWDAGAVTLDLTLTGRVGAFRQSEKGGWLALGWDLSGTGCVTRSIVGLPDERCLDLRAASTLGTQGSAGVAYLKALEDYGKDAMLDRYSYTFPGGGGSFVIRDGAVVQTPASDNTVELTAPDAGGVRDFTVTTPDGTRMEYREREHVTHHFTPSSYARPYSTPDYSHAVSTWHLTRIVSPGGTDTVTYVYDTLPSWNRQTTSSSRSYTVTYPAPGSGTAPTLSSPVPDLPPSVSTTTFEDQRALREIRSRTATVRLVRTARSGVQDTPASLTGIEVRDPAGRKVREATLVKGTDKYSRLKLREVTVSCGDTLLDSHLFTYHAGSPTHTDFFGYGTVGGDDAHIVIDPATGQASGKLAPDFAACRAGALETHVTAGGLTTTYAYEAAVVTAVVKGVARPFTIGLRVKAVTAEDAATGRRRVRTFTYSGGVPDIDPGFLTAGAFVSVSGTTVPTVPAAGVAATRTVTFLSSSRLPGIAPETATALHPRVTEDITGTGLGHAVRTEYEFNTAPARPAFLPLGATINGTGGNGPAGRYIPLPGTGLPYGCPAGVGAAISTGSFMPGSYVERAGGAPLLTRVTRMEHTGGSYRTVSTETRMYVCRDSVTLQTGLYHEPLVCTKTQAGGNTVRQYTGLGDLAYSETRATCTRHYLDSVTAVTYFPDGSSRLATERHLWSGPDVATVRVPGGGTLNGQPVYVLVPDPAPFHSDTVSRKTGLRLPTGVRRREGGHVTEHYTAFTENIRREGGATRLDAARAAGQRTLPVIEMWVADGRDTIVRHIEYGRFSGAYRPTRVTLRANGGARLDMQRVRGYTPRGLPTGVSSPGRPDESYTWDAGGRLASATTGTGALALRTSYTHRPLVGCTSVTAPDGGRSVYTYNGGRLTSATDPSGTVTKKWEYTLAGVAHQSATRIRESSRVNDAGAGAGSFSSVSTYYDGFGLPVLSLSEGFGSGGDVGAVTRYDALHRATAEWNPLPVSTVAGVLSSDTPLESASSTLHGGDRTAAVRYSYPVSLESRPRSVTMQGSGFSSHPSTVSHTCSHSTEAARKVRRLSVSGGRLVSGGHYSTGELDCTDATDGNGHHTLTFTDALGRVVLVRRTASGGYADTYTVSDPWGNPLVVLPPEASAQLGSGTGPWELSSGALAGRVWLHTYDSRLRPRTTVMPGGGACSYAYDRDGRLAFTRDAVQAASGRRTAHLYDLLGREALRVQCADNASVWASDLSAATPAATVTLTGKAGGGGIAGSGYTDTGGLASTLGSVTLISASYYDGYSFRPASWTAVEPSTPAGAMASAPGSLTGTLESLHGASGTVLTVNTYRKGGVLLRSETGGALGMRVSRTVAPSVSGLPLSETVRVKGTGVDRSETMAHTYDAFGRPLETTLSHVASVSASGQSPAVRRTVASFSYDALGEVSSETLGGSVTRTLTRDIRRNLSSWSCPQISQTLHYGSSGSVADWCGRITRKVTTCGAKTRTYDYSYSPQGFLTKGAYSSGVSGEDFTEEAGHDLNGNLTWVRRSGLLAGGGWGTIANVGITRKGDLAHSLRPRGVTPNPMEAQAVSPSQNTAFSHDANGNMTSDLSRGLQSMDYNILNLPSKATFRDGSRTSWVYTSSGEKLREIHESADGLSDRTTLYFGGMVFVNGSFSRYETPWGCMKDIASQFHVYIRDYQGNIVGVANTGISTNPLVQFTDYYPYGMPHGDATGASANRHKFGGKEYLTESGLNELDFGARHMLPQYGMFTSPDPKAADFRHLSPWAYCAGDPVNNTDPTGMSTHVIGIGNGRYEVVGGNLKDNDLGIYVVKPALGLAAYYERTGERIGVTTSITSFYNSDDKVWAVGSIIDMSDNSGMRFLAEIMTDTPPLEYYALNATTGGLYDFKKSNGGYPCVNTSGIYRGMVVKNQSTNTPLITSARDIGNIAAGYVAAVHGLSWEVSRFGFDSYQSLSDWKLSTEGPSTQNAEYIGWQWGRESISGLSSFTNLLLSPAQTDERFKADIWAYIKSWFKQ